MQEMTITSVHALGPRYAVILKEKDADRYLPILVGASDANAIAIKLHNPQVSLNLTHDLLCTVIDALGGSVRQVLINRDCPYRYVFLAECGPVCAVNKMDSQTR